MLLILAILFYIAAIGAMHVSAELCKASNELGLQIEEEMTREHYVLRRRRRDDDSQTV